MADMPRAAAAAPSPAIVMRDQLLIVSGDDGSHAEAEAKSEHPGFPRDILSYHPRQNTWSSLGESPLSVATAPVVVWHDMPIILNGEVKPGKRTPEVWAADVQ